MDILLKFIGIMVRCLYYIIYLIVALSLPPIIPQWNLVATGKKKKCSGSTMTKKYILKLKEIGAERLI